MAIESKFEIGAEGFAILTRLFMALKRAGRVIDVVWFQESPDYARAVLALAEDLDDADVNDAADRLRLQLHGFLAPRRNGASVKPPQEATVRPLAPIAEAPAPVSKQPSAPEPRYKTTLR